MPAGMRTRRNTMQKLIELNDDYTISEKVLVDYIEAHIDELPEMKISELAEKTYTSNATIVRLSRKLGFAGFRELKADLIKRNEANKFINKTVDFSKPILNDQTARDVIDSMTSLYRESLNMLCASLKAADIQTFGELLNRAGKIFIYSIGDTQATTDVFINKLLKLNCYALSANARGEFIRISSNASKNDNALFVSYSGVHDSFKASIPILKKSGCTILAVTAHADSYISKSADHTIIIPNEESEDRIATFYSQFAFTYVLNILYGMIYLKRKNT